MVRILVIADDLSGALDTGVQLLSVSDDIRVRLLPEIGRIPTDRSPRVDFAHPRVDVVDTESRHLEPARAAQRIRSVIQDFLSSLNSSDELLLYKKTDSTLRGNIGAELAAALESLPDRCMVFAPAYPAQNRSVKNGILYVNGTPLGETEFAADVLDPVHSSSIARVIHLQTRGRVALADSPEKIGANAESGTIVIADARTDADLGTVAAAVREIRLRSGVFPLIAGSAGFAAQLPHIVGSDTPGRHPETMQDPASSVNFPIRKPILFVNGSLHPVSRTQIENAVADGCPAVFIFAAPSPGEPLSEGQDLEVGEVARRLQSEDQCILSSPLRKIESRDGSPREVAHVLGGMVARILDRTPVGTLVVFGGDTLAETLKAAGVGTVVPIWEPWPGIVCSRLAGRDNPTSLVSKAGGFGDPNLIREIKRASEPSPNREGDK